MKLRIRLTISFTLLVAVILFIFSVFIYFSSEDFRKDQFKERLRDKANNTAKLLLEVQEVDKYLMNIIDRNTRTLVNEYICIFDQDHELLYSSYKNDKEVEILRNVIPEIIKHKECHFNYEDKEAIGIVYNFNNKNYFVTTSATDTYGNGKTNYLKWLLIFSFLASIIIILLTGYLFSKQALYPITQVVQDMDKISASNLNTRLKERKSKDEIYTLTKTFNKMLDRIEEAFNLQKNFVRDASHELRTPLTSITSQIDVTLLKSRENEEYRETLVSIREDISRMNSMVNGLLHLAQSYTDVYSLSVKPVRVDEIIFECQKDLQKIYPDMTIYVDWEKLPETENDLYISGSDQLLKTMFNNLADNAYKFSDDKKVHIRIFFDEFNIQIRYTNTGKVVSDEEIYKIFEPFYRGKNSQDTPGSGIGLSLVIRIVEFHNGTISFNTDGKSQTSILLSLPKIKQT